MLYSSKLYNDHFTLVPADARLNFQAQMIQQRDIRDNKKTEVLSYLNTTTISR
jgi:hypothetical protein